MGCARQTLLPRPIKAVGGTVSLPFFNSLLLRKDLPQNHLVSLSFPPVLFFPNYLLLPLFHILVVRLSISTVFFTKKKTLLYYSVPNFPPLSFTLTNSCLPVQQKMHEHSFFKKRVSRSRPRMSLCSHENRARGFRRVARGRCDPREVEGFRLFNNHYVSFPGLCARILMAISFSLFSHLPPSGFQ